MILSVLLYSFNNDFYGYEICEINSVDIDVDSLYANKYYLAFEKYSQSD